jgi:hypothetical protein
MAEDKFAAMMIGLVNCGIKKVRVHYEGGGDEGSIDTINFTTDPDVEFEDIVTDWSEGARLDNYNSGLYALVSDFCNDTLLNDIEDWWNDEGGYGEIHIDVDKGTYFIENNIRITDYETYTHNGNLADKNIK